jgi:hypothetical protein
MRLAEGHALTLLDLAPLGQAGSLLLARLCSRFGAPPSQSSCTERSCGYAAGLSQRRSGERTSSVFAWCPTRASGTRGGFRGAFTCCLSPCQRRDAESSQQEGDLRRRIATFGRAVSKRRSMCQRLRLDGTRPSAWPNSYGPLSGSRFYGSKSAQAATRFCALTCVAALTAPGSVMTTEVMEWGSGYEYSDCAPWVVGHTGIDIANPREHARGTRFSTVFPAACA